MPFYLTDVVPWGRSFDEYRRMFALTDDDLGGRILGCADGPASFNAEAHQHGYRVVSCDPLYRFGAEQIRRRIGATFDEVIQQTQQNRDQFIWSEFSSVEDLGRARMRAMNGFLGDFAAGWREGRYIDAELPALPFEDHSFDLAVCSHFLFLYSLQFDELFHERAVRDLCRVAGEVRIFPLVALDGRPSPHVEPVSAAMRRLGCSVSVEQVDYEFQCGADKMLRVRRD
jgi:hypothetical protein